MDLQTWQRFVNEFFTVDAVLTISLPSETDQDRSFSISFPLIPRLFHTWSESGLTSLTFLVERIKETFLPNNLLLLDSNKMRLLSTLQNGQQLVEHSGTLRILFCSSSKIQFMELTLTAFEQFVNSKSENLFTLPLQAGFDQAVHNFLEMLVLVQASFGNIGGTGNVMSSSSSSLPGMATLTLDNSGFQHQQDVQYQMNQMNTRPTHLPTLLPKPPTPVEPHKPIQPTAPRQQQQPPPPQLKFESYTPPAPAHNDA